MNGRWHPIGRFLTIWRALSVSFGCWAIRSPAGQCARLLGNSLASSEPPSGAAEPAGTGPGHPGHPKIILPTDPDVAEVWNRFSAAESGTANVSEICRTVAEKSGANSESLRRKFSRWKRGTGGYRAGTHLCPSGTIRGQCPLTCPLTDRGHGVRHWILNSRRHTL